MAFVDQDEFEAMKTLSGRRAPRCDKDQFRAKMTVSKVKRGNSGHSLTFTSLLEHSAKSTQWRAC